MKTRRPSGIRMPEPFEGQVYLVGAGPGDPGLLTLKGAHYLQRADVILYDDLLDDRLLELAAVDCEKIYVGKRGGRKSRSQEEINKLLIKHAGQQQVVVRLKGGDPFVFGRGGEEALALREAGISFEIVSGVTAAAGAPAYAGIPLTHRGLSGVAILVTGQEDPSGDTPPIDWPALAKLEATLVIFMGARKLAHIGNTLLQHGRPPQTPVALIEWGTWPRQRTVVTTLKELMSSATAEDINSPTLVMMGGVVELREELDWFERKPLFGRRLLITRARDQAADLQMLLEAHGAHVITLPLLEIGPPGSYDDLDAAIEKLKRFDWLVFTSPNAVGFFFGRLEEKGKDCRAIGEVKVAAVGRATSESLRERGLVADLIPQRQSQEGLVDAYRQLDVHGQAFLLPGSSLARPLLAEDLKGRGASVETVAAYDNRPPASIQVPDIVKEHGLDMAVFASPSSIYNLFDLLSAESAAKFLSDAAIACMGPTTASAATELGLSVAVQPADSSVQYLVQAICDHYTAD